MMTIMTTTATINTPNPDNFPAPTLLTRGPGFHFFGYYDKTPWDRTGRRILCLQTDFMNRRPGESDVAQVCVVDTNSGKTHIVGQTRAWNWQQGAMLQWVPNTDTIIYNDREGEGNEARFVARLVNISPDNTPGTPRTLPLPIYAVSPTGLEGISLSFSRLFDVRPGYGYAGVPDRWASELCPQNDGLYRVHFETGDARLIFSVSDAARLGSKQPGFDTGKHRFNHAQWNTDGTRFAVLHRWSVERDTTRNRAPWCTRLLTLAPDGSDPRLVSDHEMVSHYDWRDGDTLLAWAYHPDKGNRYYLFPDQTGAVPTAIGEDALTVDGHCSFEPNPRRRFVLSDTYPDITGHRTLFLFDTQTDARHDLGRLWGPTPPDGEIRCDLHPRWNRTGTHVCIDSIHENGNRQMYELDVQAYTGI